MGCKRSPRAPRFQRKGDAKNRHPLSGPVRSGRHFTSSARGARQASAAAKSKGTEQKARTPTRPPPQCRSLPPPRRGRGHPLQVQGMYRKGRHTTDRTKGVQTEKLDHSTPNGELKPSHAPRQRDRDSGPAPEAPRATWPMSGRTDRPSASLLAPVDRATTSTWELAQAHR